MNEDLKAVFAQRKLNQRDQSQLKTTWDRIVTSGDWMRQMITENKATTPEFDMIHNLRHSLRDLFRMTTELVLRGHTIYSRPVDPTSPPVSEHPQWNPMSEAPHNATEVVLLLREDNGHVFARVGHWAHGGGEDQPHYGPAWFERVGQGFHEIRLLAIAWHPMPKVEAIRREARPI